MNKNLNVLYLYLIGFLLSIVAIVMIGLAALIFKELAANPIILFKLAIAIIIPLSVGLVWRLIALEFDIGGCFAKAETHNWNEKRTKTCKKCGKRKPKIRYP